MEIIKVGICMEDNDFSTAIARGLAMAGRRMEIHVLHDRDNEELMDLILSDKKSNDVHTLYLSESNEEELYLQKGPYSIYRYSDSIQMTDAIYYLYFKLTGKVVRGRENNHCHLIEGISISGGAGVTMTLISMAKMIYRTYGSRCLYLSLSPFNIRIYDGKLVKDGSFLKLLYYLGEEREFPIKSFITETEEVDYLAAGIFNSHYGEFNLDFLINLLKKIDMEGKYDFLILDIGNHFTTETISLLEVAEGVLFVRGRNEGKLQDYFPNFSREIKEWEQGGTICEVLSMSEDGENKFSDFEVSITETFNLNENYGTEIGRIVKWIGENIGYEKSE